MWELQFHIHGPLARRGFVVLYCPKSLVTNVQRGSLLAEGTEIVEMEVVGVAPEPNSNRPLVWLKDKEQRMFLPISIGNFEATAIYMEIYNEPPPRPLCYDLMRQVVEQVGAKVDRIVINALKDDTFFAEITLSGTDGSFTIDSRPSDAIALALRVEAPIFADPQVIQEAGLTIEGEDGPAIWGEEPDQETETVEVLPEVVPDGDALLVSLKGRLKKAVSNEDYEEAARIRDEIGRLNQ